MKILITENQRHLLRLVGQFSEILDNEFNNYVKNKMGSDSDQWHKSNGYIKDKTGNWVKK